ncbi:hypothetical protein HZA86_03770 [Candidatus Uhrbacteria bacterium]|nr:hypothetical protein [Candidatus Uhrbacteria bacterium]
MKNYARKHIGKKVVRYRTPSRRLSKPRIEGLRNYAAQESGGGRRWEKR